MARVRHPETNGKPERVCGGLQHKPHFIEASAEKTVHSGGGDSGHVGSPFHTKAKMDPVSGLADWCNNELPHMSPDRDKRETLAQAFAGKMPKEKTVIGEQT